MSRFLAFVAVLPLRACGILAPAKSPEAELFDCRATAIEHLIGDREAALSAARDIYAGRKNLTQLVAGLRSSRAQVARLLTELEACEPDAGAGDAGPAAVEGEVAQ